MNLHGHIASLALGVALCSLPAAVSAILLPDDVIFVLENGRMVKDNSIVTSNTSVYVSGCPRGACAVHSSRSYPGAKMTFYKTAAQALSYQEWEKQIRTKCASYSPEEQSGHSGCALSVNAQTYEKEYLNPLKERAVYSRTVTFPTTTGVEMPMEIDNVVGPSRIFLMEMKDGVMTAPQTVRELEAAGVPVEFVERVRKFEAVKENNRQEAMYRTVAMYAGVAVGIIALLAGGWFVYKRRRR